MKNAVLPTEEEITLNLGIKVEYYYELLLKFFSRLEGRINEIEKAINSNRIDVLREKSHSLKGAATNLLLEPITIPIKALEEISLSGDISDAPQRLDELKQAYQALADHLSSSNINPY
jgi:HPt (histidine-containing phosphotransfer) domain-containing protein